MSIVIPAFNEAERIGPTLSSIQKYFDNCNDNYDHEIVVVDDGSTDSTAHMIQKFSEKIPHITLIRHLHNKGKGAAVKTGMLSAQGNLRLVMDADGSTSIQELDKLLPYITQGYDVISGSRRVAGASIQVRQNLLREVLGYVFRLVSHVIVPVDVVDTQNGFKLFSRTAVNQVFPDLQTEGWSFDVEILLLAKKKGLKIKEVPVAWSNDRRSRMTFAGMLRMLVDLWKIQSRLGN